MADGFVAGSIRPGANAGDPPVFEVTPREDWAHRQDDCHHSAFRLDERWNRVTCGLCEEVLDPFAVLMRYAAWWHDFDRQRQRARAALRELYREELRRLRRLRDCSDEEAAEIDSAIERWWSAEPDDLRQLARRIETAIRERKQARRAQKRQRQT